MVTLPVTYSPPVSSSLTSQGARNKNEPPSTEFFTSRRAGASEPPSAANLDSSLVQPPTHSTKPTVRGFIATTAQNRPSFSRYSPPKHRDAMAGVLQGEKQLFEKFWKGTFKAVAMPRPESIIVASITARRAVT
ncbi:hypothetical protein QQF64_026653, partial [Cirrhinus molitorella]